MGIFKRGAKPGIEPQPPDNPDLSTLLLEGQDMIGRLAQAHAHAWGLGTADQWALDQGTGRITWTFPDRTATAPAQILGSHSPGAGSWLWAWANDSIIPEMSRDAAAVRDWGEAHGHAALTTPKLVADEEQAATLAALALRISGASGFYRGAGSGSTPFITFGPVTITDSDGNESTFGINVN